MLTNSAKGSFQLSFKKNDFPFSKWQNGFFCEAGANNMVQNGTTTIFTQSTSYFMDNVPIL